MSTTRWGWERVPSAHLPRTLAQPPLGHPSRTTCQDGPESPNGSGLNLAGETDGAHEDELAMAGGRLVYDSDDEKELDPNFLDTDDFRQCDFELGGWVPA